MAKISFYFDEMVSRALADAVTEKGFSVVLANDIGMTGKNDDEHLKTAAERGMVLFTLDQPFAGRTTKRSDHAGLVCWTRDNQPIGAMLQALVEFAKAHSPESTAGQVFWLK